MPVVQADIQVDDKSPNGKSGLNPGFPLGLEMTTQSILMDFLWKFEGNSHSIDRKFAQKRRKMGKLMLK